MFTPQRKSFLGRSISPQSDGLRNVGLGSISASRKGKGIIAGAEGPSPPPPQASLADTGGNVDGGDIEVWHRFREGGLMDEAALEQKDRDALVEKISKLESELYDYQYNMGILLIEKNEWTSKYEELRQFLAEVEEILKREQGAHLIAITEVERREENLRNALEVEKQCVADLEKALREMQSTSTNVRFSSEKKFADANALAINIEGRNAELQNKLHAADAKLAEAHRKSSEIERRLQELENRESVLRSERLSLKAEQDAQETALAKEREDLKDWEKNLQAIQDRLHEEERILKKREGIANEKERTLNDKAKYVEEEKKKIEMTSLGLKEKEADISKRLASLPIKEMEATAHERSLNIRRRELLALEEKLDSRERMEIQKLVDEHTVVLDSKKRELELQMDQRRKSMDKELENKLSEIKQKEEEINQKDIKVSKKEQSLESELERVKEKEKDHELKVKALKEREKTVIAGEKSLDMDRKKMEAEKQEILNLKANLQKEQIAFEEENLRLLKTQENLRITEDERSTFSALQLKLKEEISSYHHEKESLKLEKENLRQERDNFEREWIALDEKKIEIEKELDKIDREKRRLEKWKHDEDERLERKILEMKSYVQSEQEALRLERSAFEGTIQHEQSEMLEKARRDYDDTLRKIDIKNRGLEADIQRRREEMEKHLQAKEKELELEKESTLKHIDMLKDQVQREMAEMSLERQKIEREKKEVYESRKNIERDRLEIQADINELQLLSMKLKNQREAFIKEKKSFLGLVEGYKNCRNCGELMFSNLKLLSDIEDTEANLPPKRAEESVRETACEPESSVKTSFDIFPGSGGRLSSWLQKCTARLSNTSPAKKGQDAAIQEQDDAIAGRALVHSDGAEPSLGVGNNRSVQPSFREVEVEPSLSADDQRNVEAGQEISKVFSKQPENVEESDPLKQRYSKLKPLKKGRLKSNRSVKQVVEEAKVFLGETLEPYKDGQPNGKGKNPALSSDGDQKDTQGANHSRKRQYTHVSQNVSEQDTIDSEAKSDSVTTGGRRKKQQSISSGMQAPGERRYNLRRSTVAGASSAVQPLSALNVERRDHLKLSDVSRNKILESPGNPGNVPSNLIHTDAPSEVAGGKDESFSTSQRKEGSTEVHAEFSSPRSVKIEAGSVSAESTESESEAGGLVRRPDNQIDDAEENGAEISEYGNGFASESYEVGDESGLDDDDSENHDASIGKKLWNFFTT